MFSIGLYVQCPEDYCKSQIDNKDSLFLHLATLNPIITLLNQLAIRV